MLVYHSIKMGHKIFFSSTMVLSKSAGLDKMSQWYLSIRQPHMFIWWTKIHMTLKQFAVHSAF